MDRSSSPCCFIVAFGGTAANSTSQFVYQCLYSQCDTAAPRSIMPYPNASAPATIPPIPDRDDLRRREQEYASGKKRHISGSAVRFLTESTNFPTQCVNFPTQSANYPTQSISNSFSSNAIASVAPFFTLNTNTAAIPSPAITSRMPAEPSRMYCHAQRPLPLQSSSLVWLLE